MRENERERERDNLKSTESLFPLKEIGIKKYLLLIWDVGLSDRVMYTQPIAQSTEKLKDIPLGPNFVEYHSIHLVCKFFVKAGGL